MGLDDATTPSRRKQTTKRYAGYPRVSRVGARDDERLRSPEFQAELIAGFGREHGLDVEIFPAELDVSGSKRSRAILDQILARIEAGELAGIIVAKLNRLSRLKPTDRLELFQRIEAAGGEVLSASEPNDMSTPEGRFAREMFLALARMEWERYADQFAHAKENAVELGIAIKARAPFGYRFDGEHGLAVVPDEARVVCELYELRAGGASYGACLALFEARTGRRSYRQTMKSMLTNRAYLGELHYGRTAATRLVNLEAHAAIVEPGLFEAVQAVNTAADDAGGRRHNGRAASLLAGIAECANCGRGLVRTKTGSRPAYAYKCPNDARHCSARAHIQAGELEAHVVERVLAWAGGSADELVETEVALEPAAERERLELRLAQAQTAALEYEANVELELEVGAAAYAAGREARRQLVERRRNELAALGAATELETVRSTLRRELAGDSLTTDEKRGLLAIALAAVVVCRTPYRLAPVELRAELVFADATAPEETPELLEHARAELIA